MAEGDVQLEIVRLLYHLNGYSVVLVECTEGLGMANGGIEWEIPTELIPPHLRGLGSRFRAGFSKSRPRPEIFVKELDRE
jgi:hypothetical protein